MNNKEIWRDIENYESYYQISNYGRVKSLDRIIIRSDNKKQFVKSRIMKSFLTKQYYWRVSLRKNGTIKKYNVHRLVAQAFIKNSKNKPEVNHKNGIKFDNYFKNLEWATSSENTIHAVKTGLQKACKGEACYITKLTTQQVKEIKKELKIPYWGLNKFLATKYNISRSSIKEIKANRNWKHIKV